MLNKILRAVGAVLGVAFFLFGIFWLLANDNSGFLKILNGITFMITGVYFTFYGVTGRSTIFTRRSE